MEYLFGPVLSRRLGLSLGVDLLQNKTCNLDCVYCELGGTTCLTSCRNRFVSPEKVLREIKSRAGESFDFLTFAGSGEPTLSIDLGEILARARKLVDSPIAVITNSTLLDSPQVRREISSADVILPSLDAATEPTFRAINKPDPRLKIESVIEGLRALRREFQGEIWLEVMLVKGINEHEVELIARAAESIEPDRVQLNTVVRPPAEPVEPLDEEKMEALLEIFDHAELIPDWDWRVPPKMQERLEGLLSREPCTLEDIALQLDLEGSAIIKYVKILERDGRLGRKLQDGRYYFYAIEG